MHRCSEGHDRQHAASRVCGFVVHDRVRWRLGPVHRGTWRDPLVVCFSPPSRTGRRRNDSTLAARFRSCCVSGVSWSRANGCRQQSRSQGVLDFRGADVGAAGRAGLVGLSGNSTGADAIYEEEIASRALASTAGCRIRASGTLNEDPGGL